MKKHLFYFLFFLSLSIKIYGQNNNIIIDKKDTIVTNSSVLKDTIYFKQIENFSKAQNSFDLKLWLPTFTSLLVLLITNLITLYKIRKDTIEAIKKDVIITKIKIERERLEKFYDPIYTALLSNSSIFDAYGPQSFPKDSGVLETEASQVWQLLVENVIIPNNQKIGNVIQQFSHLKNNSDNLNSYLKYLVHLESFEHFVKYPNTIHKAFKYPTSFISTVEANRNQIINGLIETEKKLSI